jgi:ApbE superfamily uncharacterized protein (UPF0280 family)
MNTKPQNRTYRSLISDTKLASFRVVVKETDLLVRANRPLEDETIGLIVKHRAPLERYIERNPGFVQQLTPVPQDRLAPPIVKAMISAADKAGVGPMASVAGAIAEFVGRDLLGHSEDVIIENGGDVFMMTGFPLVAAVYAGKSPLSGKIGVRIEPSGEPVAVCTSSGTLGHSLSLGRADAALVISGSATLADAAATAIGNRVQSKGDINPAIDFGKEIQGVEGIVVILGKEIGLWGNLDLRPISSRTSA